MVILKTDGLSYGLCSGLFEFFSQLFVTCNVVANRWYRICRSIGLYDTLSRDLTLLYYMFISLGILTMVRGGLTMI